MMSKVKHENLVKVSMHEKNVFFYLKMELWFLFIICNINNLYFSSFNLVILKRLLKSSAVYWSL